MILDRKAQKKQNQREIVRAFIIQPHFPPIIKPLINSLVHSHILEQAIVSGAMPFTSPSFLSHCPVFCLLGRYENLHFFYFSPFRTIRYLLFLLHVIGYHLPLLNSLHMCRLRKFCTNTVQELVHAFIFI